MRSHSQLAARGRRLRAMSAAELLARHEEIRRQMFEDYDNGCRRNEDDADEDSAIYAVLLDRVSADKATMAKYLATDRAHGDNDIPALAGLLA